MTPRRDIYFDITGYCNAQCPYCSTGPGKLRQKTFISKEMFASAILRLKQNNLITRNTVIGLFNWAEPFLHPHFNAIIEVLNNEEISFSLSTNASLVHEFPPNSLRNLKSLYFSMSGFSQASYDRIHGFNFEKIKSNITNISRNARLAGFKGSSTILFHVYQFNLNEIQSARRFAKRLRMGFDPHLAIINEWDKMEAFVQNKLPYSDLLRMSQELLLYKLYDTIHRPTLNYTCPYASILAIDESCNVLVCCHSPKYDSTFIIGNLLKDDISKILARKFNNPICQKCLDIGLAYYINNSSESIDFGSRPSTWAIRFFGFINKLMNKIILPM